MCHCVGGSPTWAREAIGAGGGRFLSNEAKAAEAEPQRVIDMIARDTPGPMQIVSQGWRPASSTTSAFAAVATMVPLPSGTRPEIKRATRTAGAAAPASRRWRDCLLAISCFVWSVWTVKARMGAVRALGRQPERTSLTFCILSIS